MKQRSKQEPLAYLVGLVRAGTYPWVAARAAGISDSAFREFMDERSPHRFEILQAEAQSRAKAEIELRDKNPLAWLRYGPGRPSREGPGWTGAARAATDDSDRTQEVIEQFNRLAAGIFDFAKTNPDFRLPLAAWIEVKDSRPGMK